MYDTGMETEQRSRKEICAMFTINAIATIRMCCRMFSSQAYPYGRAHSSCLCFVDV
mgnify:FL=1